MFVSRVILHLDMDAFFAAVEQRDHPGWRGKAVIVGAPAAERGVVCCPSYEARRFGVRSAMPSAVACRLCPQAIWVRPRFEAYAQESERIMEILAGTGVPLEESSIDEAYLDLTALCPGDSPDAALLAALPLAKALKTHLATERGLTASVGIASNKLLAKIASDYQKPDGLTLIPEATKHQFLRPLPVRNLPGVGPVTEQRLHRAGLRTLADLQDDRGELVALLGPAALKLKAFALGEDDSAVEPQREQKSFHSERTFARDTDSYAAIFGCLWQQSELMAARLASSGLLACQLEVRVRYGDLTQRTRRTTLPGPSAEGKDLYFHGCLLLLQAKLLTRPLRSLGLALSQLTPHPERQLPLL